MIYAATGHRPHRTVFPRGMDPFSPEANRLLCDFAMQELPKLPEFTLGVSGMALGWDQAVAHACFLLEIPFIAAVPFKGQESRWTPRQQDRFHKLCARAQEVVIVSEGGFSSQAMLKRDDWMVSKADAVCAMFDGNPRGGTAHTVGYAKKQGVAVTNLWDRWLEYVRRA